MSDIAFSAAMDSSAVEKAYAQIIKENAKLREEMSKLATQSRKVADQDREHKKLQSEAAKKLAAEQEKLQAAGRRLREQNRTDFEKYKLEKTEAQRLLSAGVIKEEEYRRELQRLARVYKDATPQAKARQAALKAEATAAAEASRREKELAAATKKAAEEQKAAAADVENAWKTTAVGFGSAIAAGTALINTLARLREQSRTAVGAAADQTLDVDTLARQLQIQSSLTDPQRFAASRQILSQAIRAGATGEEGFRAATQLVSSGFKAPVESGTVGTILDLKQASNFKGTPEDLIQGLAQTLNAYGMERTQANARQLGVSVQSLFKRTDLQLTDLQEFAKNASVFRGANMGLDQSLAGFTALREVMPSGEAATGLRNFTTILQGAGATKGSTDALGALGLKPDQVDFVGENLVQVLTRLRDATKGMAEEDRNAGLIKLFGRENFASASLLMNNPERITELTQMQGDTGQFDRDVQTARSSMQAERNRVAVRQQLLQMNRADETHQRDMEFRREEARLLDESQRAHNRGILAGAAVDAIQWTGQAVSVLAPVGFSGSERDQAPELLNESPQERADREAAARQSKADYRRRMGLPPADEDPAVIEQKKTNELLGKLVEQQAGNKQAGAAAARRTKQGEAGP